MTTERKKRYWEIINLKALVITGIAGLLITLYVTFLKPQNKDEPLKINVVHDSSNTSLINDSINRVHIIEQGKGAVIENSTVNQRGKEEGLKQIKMGDSSTIKKSKILQ